MTQDSKALVIELWYNNIEYASAQYSEFQIGDSSSKYTLNFNSFVNGTAGDSLNYHKGIKFTTFDQNNDNAGGNCGQDYLSGWWFNNCYNANLNGNYSSGIHYTTWKGYTESMSQVIMKIK